MPGKTQIAVSGNIPELVSVISAYQGNSAVKFSEHSLLNNPKYHLFLIDTSGSLENISQKLIIEYGKCREYNSKLLACLIFEGEIQKDKVMPFKKLLDDLGKGNPLHRLVITRELYSDNYPEPATQLDKELTNILRNNAINISTKGNNYIYPLFINDFLEAIIKILFLNSASGKTLYLLGDQLKDLELAYLIKKIVTDDNPDFQINLVSENIIEDPEITNLANSAQVNLGWHPTTDFEITLKDLFQKIKSNPEEYVETSTTKAETNTNQINNILKNKILILGRLIKPHREKEEIEGVNKKRIFGKIIVVSSVSYLILCSIFAFCVYESFRTLAGSLDSLKQGSLPNSVNLVNKTIFYDQVAINIYWPIRPLVRLFSSNFDDELYNLFTFNQYLQGSLENLQQSYVLSEKIYNSFLDTSSNVSINDETLALKTSLGQVYDNLNQIDIMVNSGKLPKSITESIQKNPEYVRLGDLEIELSQAMKLINILPAMSSSNSTKQIAIIVQDQDELRSLGGVIKFLVLLNITNGKLTDVKIYNQSDIDNLSDGSVKAPNTVAQVTGIDSWKFRDMSYIGDFSQTAQYLNWYLNKTLQINPDVFIAVNKSLFESLIGDSTGISISGKTITKNNLIDKIDNNSDSDLTSVIDYYLSLYRSQKLSLAELSRSLISEAENNNLYIWAKDQITESSFLNLPFSGVINPYSCHSALGNYPTCISQTTYLTESNFMIAPINPYLNREVIHLVTLTQNEAQHEYQIKYHFTTDLSSLKRDYRLIYQLYVSGNSTLTSVTIDNQPLQINSFIKQKFNLFDYYQIPIALSTVSDHQISIKFSTPITMASDINQTAYSLSEVRQSGIRDNGFGLLIKLPDNTNPALVTAPVETKPQQIYYRYPPKTATFGVGLGLVRQ